MFKIAYRLITSSVIFSLPLVSIFSSKIKKLLASRKSSNKAPKGHKSHWFHCASLGEFEMAKPIIDQVLKTNDLKQIIITFFSDSGYEIAKKSKYGDSCMYLPFDSKNQVHKFYQDYIIEKAVFIRYELWYTVISTGLSKGIKFFMVNGRFLRDHFIYKSLGKQYRMLLREFEHIFVSESESFKLLKYNDIQNASLVGDTRYDRNQDAKNNALTLDAITCFKEDKFLLILGSSWPKEEQILQEALDGLSIKVLIAPHSIQQERISEIESMFGEEYTRYSDENPEYAKKVMILDTMGMLTSAYQYADLAFIGGGFSGQLHNILEPIGWNVPVCFGPHTTKFPEAEVSVKNEFGFVINQSADLQSLVSRLTSEPEYTANLKERLVTFNEEQKGAVSKIMNYL